MVKCLWHITETNVREILMLKNIQTNNVIITLTCWIHRVQNKSTLRKRGNIFWYRVPKWLTLLFSHWTILYTSIHRMYTLRCYRENDDDTTLWSQNGVNMPARSLNQQDVFEYTTQCIFVAYYTPCILV